MIEFSNKFYRLDYSFYNIFNSNLFNILLTETDSNIFIQIKNNTLYDT